MPLGTNRVIRDRERIKERGTCFWCIKAVKWIPVLFIVTVVFWSYYAYVVQLCIFTIESNIKKILYLIVYHLLFGMFFWAYWQTIFTEIGRVPYKFKMPASELDRLIHADNEEMIKQILESFGSSLPVTNRTITGSVRYCDKCKHVKPDRSHHCSVCGECVLKMDHHCPWVNNCVSFTNYKYFILFLGYSLLYCLFVSLTSLEYFILFWRVNHGDPSEHLTVSKPTVLQGKLEGNGRFHILFLFFVALMFAVSLVSLFCYHCYLVLHNRSTLEAFRAPIFRTGPDKNGFSLGRYNNFLEVFGDNPKAWFLPVYSSLGDGVVFPVQTQHQLGNYQSMDNTHTRRDRNIGFAVDGGEATSLCNPTTQVAYAAIV